MDFDPYATWLGIPDDRRPPTYYDLLGVAVDESDPAAIEQAALRRMSKVRQHQIGPHSDLSQEVLSELARARLILMDPDRRAEYDATLRARDESRPAPWADPKIGETTVTRRRRRPPEENAADGLGSLVIVEPGRRRPANPPPRHDQGASSTEEQARHRHCPGQLMPRSSVGPSSTSSGGRACARRPESRSKRASLAETARIDASGVARPGESGTTAPSRLATDDHSAQTGKQAARTQARYGAAEG